MNRASLTNSRALAIGSLIADRCRELELRRIDLVQRMNYKNQAKGLRRLEELLAGELDRTKELIRALPEALEVPPVVVERAIAETRRQLAEAEEAARQSREQAWRSAFRPHAVIVTERTTPEPIFVAAAIGVRRLLHIDFDPALEPLTYVKQALDGVRRKLSEFQTDSGTVTGVLPAFGRPIGVVVNYTPDRAIRFDLDGNPIELLPRAHCPGEAYMVLAK